MIRTTDNNGGEELLKLDASYCSDLDEIANRSLKVLAKDYPDLLVFPRHLGQYKDDIEKSYIFSLYDSKLTTYNTMGFIGRNKTQLTIASRFAKDDMHDFFLHYMLSKVLSLNIVNLDTATNRDNVENFLPYLFPAYLRRALSQGVFKEYCIHEYNNENVNGTIDIPRHIRLNFPFNGKISYNVREYSFDNSITELIRHTIEYLKTTDIGNSILTRDQTMRYDIQKIIRYTPSYNKNERKKIINKNKKPLRHPYFVEYLPLQRLCLQILSRWKISFGTDKDRIHGLLFNGAWLWEEYLNTILKDHFKHPRNKTKEGKDHLFISSEGAPCQEIYPYFIGKNNGTIADAKYKRLENRNEEYGRDDYYQILAYMYRYKSKHGFLLFPHPKELFESNYSLKDNSEVKLTKLGLAIPQHCDSFKDFREQINRNEENFLEKICKS